MSVNTRGAGLKFGDKLTVEIPSEVTFVGFDSDTGTIKVEDANGYTNYIYAGNLELVFRSPFEDGRLYVDRDGDFFRYSADDGGKGTWLTFSFADGASAGSERSYDYPTRPLTAVTVSDAIKE